MIKQCNTCKREFINETDLIKHSSRWRVCTKGNLWFNCTCGSTLMLKKGKYSWYSPDKLMSPKAASVFNRLAGKEEIPHLPSTIQEIQQLLNDKNISSNKLANAIKKDPITASTVLNTAINMQIAGDRPIHSLEHAISYIGRETLKELIVISAIRNFTLKTKHFDGDEFWQNSLLAGMISEELTKKFASNLISDEVYIAATLANIGKIIMALVNPGVTDKIYMEIMAPNTANNWNNIEGNYDIADHKVLGEIASILWGLPPYIRDVTSYHHNLNKILIKQKPNRKLDLLDIVAVSIQIGHWVNYDIHQINYNIINRFKQKVAIDDVTFENLMQDFYTIKDQMINNNKISAA